MEGKGAGMKGRRRRGGEYLQDLRRCGERGIGTLAHFVRVCVWGGVGRGWF